MPYGRPMKGKTRRIPITIHTTEPMLTAIDKYVADRDRQEDRAYTRSDFWNEAAGALLRQLGRAPVEDENAP